MTDSTLSALSPLERLVARAEQLMQRIESVLPQPLQAPADWDDAIAWRYRKRANGCGVLEPVRHVGPCSCPICRTSTCKRTRLPATPSSSSGPHGQQRAADRRARHGQVLADPRLPARYAPQGLRLIEVDKADLTDLPDIVDVVAGRPEKFIIYCDDLSFEEGEPGYKAMKSILDGSVAATPMCWSMPPATAAICCPST
jgi:hypothetical protein